MVVSPRRRVRRLQLGATPNTIAMRWMGQWIVWIQVELIPALTRPVSRKAHVTAEKSCPHRRRKRGLRKGKARSRVRQTRRSPPDRQPLPKKLSSRGVNHQGRKFLWARKCRNHFRGVCARYMAMKDDKVKPISEWGIADDGVTRIKQYHTCRKRNFRAALEAWWRHLDDRAKQCGIPKPAAFSSSFSSFLAIEFNHSDLSAWSEVLSILPRGGTSQNTETNRFASLLDRLGVQDQGPTWSQVTRQGVVNKTTTPQQKLQDAFGNSVRGPDPPPVTVECRVCRDLGSVPGVGFPRGCRFCCPSRRGDRRGGGSSSLNKGRRR